MIFLRPILSLLVVVTLVTGCSNRHSERNGAGSDSRQSTVDYARGFRVTYHSTYKVVELMKPYQGATTSYTYLLVQEGTSVPAHDPSTMVITIPLKTIVCTSTTHIPLLDYLGETDRLIGFPTTDYVSSEAMRKRIDQGKVKELGIDKGMDLEELVALKPSMVMGYAMSGDLGQMKKIQDMGIPVVLNSEYLESHPLGRAEWIKFVALFFNKEQKADSVFRAIEKEYLQTLEMVRSVHEKPTVMSGIVYGDTWFLPGGRNYASRLISDAGGDYLWKADSTGGFLELSFESVYERAHEADLWIGIGSFRSLAEIKASEERYSNFKAFKTGRVYTFNGRQGAKGGSEYLELGYLRPDLILKDLVKIMHPAAEPEYELYFHKQLTSR